MAIGKAKVDVEFDKAKIGRDAADAITPAIEGAAKSGAQLLAGLFVTKGLANVGKEGFGELIESQKVSAQSLVALRGEANITAADIDDLGQSMLNLAGFDDEAARSAANILLRFGAIHDTAILKRVEEDAADLAVTMGTDLPSAAQTLGQILQDPENAARKLRPIIGSLTDAQKESIASFADLGDAAGAQGVILGILEQRIGGAAKAYGDTLGGSLDKASQNMQNAKASLVDGLAPALETGSALVSSLAEDIEGLPGPLRTVASVVVGTGTVLVGLAQPVAGLASSFASLKAARLTSAAAADIDTASTLAEAEAQTVLATNSAASVSSLYAEAEAATVAGGAAGIGGFAASLGVGALAVGTFALALYTGKQYLDDWNGTGVGAVTAVGKAVERLANSHDLKNFDRDVADSIAALSENGNGIAGFADAAGKLLDETLRQKGPAAAEALLTAITELRTDGILPADTDLAAMRQKIEEFSNTGPLDATTTAIKGMTVGLQELKDTADSIAGAPTADLAAQRAIVAHERAISKANAAQDKLNEALASGDAGAISAAQADLVDANINVTSTALDQAEAQGKLADATDTLSGKQVTLASSARNVSTALNGMASDLVNDPNLQLYASELQAVADLQDEILKRQLDQALAAFAAAGDPQAKAELQRRQQDDSGNYSHGGARGMGGPVTAGTAYGFNEYGWGEQFVPQVDGTVVSTGGPGQAFTNGGTSLGSGVTINGNIVVQGSDARSALRNLPAEMNAARHLAGV